MPASVRWAYDALKCPFLERRTSCLQGRHGAPELNPQPLSVLSDGKNDVPLLNNYYALANLLQLLLLQTQKR